MSLARRQVHDVTKSLVAENSTERVLRRRGLSLFTILTSDATITQGREGPAIEIIGLSVIDPSTNGLLESKEGFTIINGRRDAMYQGQQNICIPVLCKGFRSSPRFHSSAPLCSFGDASTIVRQLSRGLHDSRLEAGFANNPACTIIFHQGTPVQLRPLPRFPGTGSKSDGFNMKARGKLVAKMPHPYPRPRISPTNPTCLN